MELLFQHLLRRDARKKDERVGVWKKVFGLEDSDAYVSAFNCADSRRHGWAARTSADRWLKGRRVDIWRDVHEAF